jgi:hypothetical protein
MGFSRFDERDMMMMKKKKGKLGGPLGNDLKRRDSILFLMSRQTFGFYTNEKTVFTPLRESEPSILLTKIPSGNGVRILGKNLFIWNCLMYQY